METKMQGSVSIVRTVRTKMRRDEFNQASDRKRSKTKKRDKVRDHKKKKFFFDDNEE